MNKSESRHATLYSVLFLVMLLFSGVTFFLGLKMGIDRTHNEYAHLLIDPEQTISYQYQQQDLVTFYLTTYSAYEKFHVQWFESINDIKAKHVSNPANLFDELASLAEKQIKEAKTTSMLGLGLLDSSQQSYIRSLEQFEQAANDFRKSLDKKSTDEAIDIINNNTHYINAIEQSLNAQHDYFTAMHKWTYSLDQSIPQSFDHTLAQSLEVWDDYPLIIKLNIISHYLKENKIYISALPQDIVSRIDEFIAKGQATQLKLTVTSDILDLLFITDAVRFGDFNEYKGNRYENEFLPKIPFIYVN